MQSQSPLRRLVGFKSHLFEKTSCASNRKDDKELVLDSSITDRHLILYHKACWMDSLVLIRSDPNIVFHLLSPWKKTAALEKAYHTCPFTSLYGHSISYGCRWFSLSGKRVSAFCLSSQRWGAPHVHPWGKVETKNSRLRKAQTWKSWTFSLRQVSLSYTSERRRIDQPSFARSAMHLPVQFLSWSPGSLNCPTANLTFIDPEIANYLDRPKRDVAGWLPLWWNGLLEDEPVPSLVSVSQWVLEQIP